MGDNYFCRKCHSTIRSANFYKSRNTEKYKDNDGFLYECKKCATMHIDIWDPYTFAYRNPEKPDVPCLLEELDMPWVPKEWNKLLLDYGLDPKVSITSIFGRYVSKMQLIQYKKCHYSDTEVLRKIDESQVRENMTRQGLSESEIQEILSTANNVITMDQVKENNPDAAELVQDEYRPKKPKVPEKEYDLEPEDKLYLANKWGRNYTEDEWIQLERFYIDMTESFNIQTPSHKDTLKHICKVSLKMNQLLDFGDVDGYQKLSKAYDGLMRSGNFTAVQNKTDQEGYLDSVSELVALCEQQGFIPRFYTDKPQDKVDRVLQDMQNYNKKLILEETNLGNMIETAMKQIQEDNERAAAINLDDGSTEENLDELERQLFGQDEVELSDQDMADFKEWEADEDGS